MPMGYHQLIVERASQEKLAFQGVDAIKWTYTVMPFGPTNGPATFINFIHDVDSIWKELAKSHGIIINNDTNTRIIVDDIVNWADDAFPVVHEMPTHRLSRLSPIAELKQELLLPTLF